MGSGVIPRKENPARFHEMRIRRDSNQSTWVEIAMLAAVDAVAAVTVVTEAVEDMAGPHLVLCHVKHQKLGHARTLKVICSPSALATRAKTVICFAPPWKR